LTKFKICGLRDADNALAAANAGAAFLGLNFVPGVRRRITTEQAGEIVARLRAGLERLPRLVGLFANQPVDEVNDIVRLCGLDLAQLCGDEPREYWVQVCVPIIRQVKIRDDVPTEAAIEAAAGQIEEVVGSGYTPMLDKYQRGHLGGTGHTFDWRVARELASRYDLVLAGGLTPDNVARAISEVRPKVVDVSSGVETGGVKDAAKIHRFAEEVRRAG